MPATWDDYFATRKWRVATEVNGTEVAEPGSRLNSDGDKSVQVRFVKGVFEIDNGVFHSPFSSARGRRGVLLQEVGSDGEDIKDSRIAVGQVVLRRARQQSAIV